MKKYLVLFISLLVFSSCTYETKFESHDQQWIEQKQFIKAIIKENNLDNSDTLKIYSNGLKHAMLDTLIFHKTVVNLIYNSEKPLMSSGYFLKIDTLNSSKNYELYNLSDSKYFIKSSLNTSEILPIDSNAYPTVFLYLFPLKNEVDIIKRVLFDVEMNFWIKDNQNEKVSILNRFNQSANLEINNFNLLHSKTENKYSYILSSNKNDEFLSLTLESLDKNVSCLFKFKKSSEGYYLEDKYIAIR